MFSATKEIQENFKKNNLPWETIFFPVSVSTNSFAKENLKSLKLPTLILTDHQTSGRGRGKNTWEDIGRGTQLLSTWVFSLGQRNPDPRWTLAFGFFLFKSLSETWPEANFSMKAPNDVFLNDKKLAGLLVEVETLSGETVVALGLGLNVFAKPEGLDQPTICLADALEKAELNEKTWTSWVMSFEKQLFNFNKFVSNENWLRIIENDMIFALNKNSFHQKNAVRKIQSDGTLELDQGYLAWLEL